MNSVTTRSWWMISCVVLGTSSLLSSCVKQSDYDLVVKQNKELDDRVQAAQKQLMQEQAASKALQERMLGLIHIQSTLQKRDQELQETRSELEALKAEFERFRSQRRGAMIGKKYPYLSLDGGKMLNNAEVVAVDATQFSIRHDGGFMKVAIAESNEQLRWEACYDPQEAKRQERERFLADARLTSQRLEQGRLNPPKPVAIKTTFGPSQAEQETRATIAAQRAQLNREYEVLRNKNPSAMKDSLWNADRPETSPMLTNFGNRPVVMGMSRLDALRDAINTNLVALQSLGVRP